MRKTNWLIPVALIVIAANIVLAIAMERGIDKREIEQPATAWLAYALHVGVSVGIGWLGYLALRRL